MLKKVFLALFGLFIVVQAVGIFALGSYLRSQTKVEIISTQIPTDMLVDSKGQLWLQPWAATYSQDFKWEVYQHGKLTQTFDMKSEPNFPIKLTEDPQGNLFGVLYTQDAGIRVVTFDGSSWNVLAEFTQQPAPSIHAFAAGSREDVWIGGIGELLHYNGSEWQTFTAENSPLPQADINTLFVDSRSRIWVGSNSGVTMIENGEFQPLPGAAPSGIYIFSLAEDQNGTIWAGGDENLYSFDGTQWTTRNSKNSKIKGGRISDVEVDSLNRVWALSSDGNVSVLTGETIKYAFTEPGKTVENIEMRPDGVLYVMRNEDVAMTSINAPLFNLVTLKFLWLLHNGVFLYLSIFLAILWIAIALRSWGIGLGLALPAILFWGIEGFSLLDINGVPSGYINPGFALTLFTFFGGLAGYFLKQRGVKRADIIGSGVGCLLGGILLACIASIFLWALASVS